MDWAHFFSSSHNWSLATRLSRRQPTFSWSWSMCLGGSSLSLSSKMGGWERVLSSLWAPGPFFLAPPTFTWVQTMRLSVLRPDAVEWGRRTALFSADYLCGGVLSPPQNRAPWPEAWEPAAWREQEKCENCRLWTLQHHGGRGVPQNIMWLPELCRTWGHFWKVSGIIFFDGCVTMKKTKTTTPIPLSVCMLEQKWTSGAVEWFCMRCCVDGCPLMTSISRPCSRKSRVLFPFPFRKCRKCEMNPLPTLRLQGGIFTIPNWVSPSARDLLYAMLAVDPIKRMSIPEIRFHILIILFLIFIPPCAVIHVLSLLWLSSESEWFNHNLPAYLKPLPEANQGIFSEPNPTVIYEVSEVGSFVSLTFSKPGISSHQVNPPCFRDWDWIPTKYQLHCWKKETMKLRWPTISSLTTMQSTSSVKHSPLSSWPDNYGTWFLTSSFLFFIPKQR